MLIWLLNNHYKVDFTVGEFSTNMIFCDWLKIIIVLPDWLISNQLQTYYYIMLIGDLNSCSCKPPKMLQIYRRKQNRPF